MTVEVRDSNLLSHGTQERLCAVIDPIVSAHGAELCDVELKNENGWVLRVTVERKGAKAERLSTKDAAVDLDLCSEIARDLSTALDVSDPIPHRYHLEVGSPGLERPLRSIDDFARFCGEKAKVKLRAAVSGQKVLTATIAAAQDGIVTLQENAKTQKTYFVRFEDVVSAHLVFEFGPAPKPVTSAKKQRKT